MKKLVLATILILAIFATILIVASTKDEIRIVTAEGIVKLNIEIADTKEEQAQGLMNREKLSANSGMLFVFAEEAPRAFWMKNTSIPLSIAFIDENKVIVDIQDMTPFDETPHRSAKPAKYALEVNQGYFDRSNIVIGDKVELK